MMAPMLGIVLVPILLMNLEWEILVSPRIMMKTPFLEVFNSKTEL